MWELSKLGLIEAKGGLALSVGFGPSKGFGSRACVVGVAVNRGSRDG